MNMQDSLGMPAMRPQCCGCGMTRREIIKTGGLVAGGLALSGLVWSAVKDAEEKPVPPRTTLTAKPILIYNTPQRRPQTSWRNWGGIETEAQAKDEMARIQKELDKIRASADFPVTFLPVSGARSVKELDSIKDVAGNADAYIVYAAGGGGDALNALAKSGKHVIIFLRHKSGPVYLWYEIISPRFLHQHTDKNAVPGVDQHDVVIDSLDELAWRLRALCGLKNTVGSRIVALGGAGGWSCPKAPDLSRERFKLDIQTYSYEDLGKLIQAARNDASAVQRSKDRARAYLRQHGIKLETDKVFVEKAFLLEQVLKGILDNAGARMFTINACMGTIMKYAETTACLALSLLNDEGYLAFCESDFVVIPSGILLAGISGRPQFLNDPTYPHAGVITLAHCTAPRKMNGEDFEHARILTHFESDYGASPKVEMEKGQKVTNIIPDFAMSRLVGLSGEIIDHPFLPICRSQIEVAYKADDIRVAENMPGFHWMTCYGDYLREVGYALRKVGIEWVNLG
ncbi:MAG: sugar isomerase [Candidatus Sumerlaeota bacterium]|nr:sugar isomerase [Candidatus Sumerlaeota bacterium]